MSFTLFYFFHSFLSPDVSTTTPFDNRLFCLRRSGTIFFLDSTLSSRGALFLLDDPPVPLVQVPNMLMKTAVTALLGLAMAAEAASVHHYRSPISLERRQNRGGNRGGNNAGNNANQGNAGQGNAGGNNNNGASATCLAANAIQTGSQSTGQSGAAAADGQVNSATYVLLILHGSSARLCLLCSQG